MDEVSRQPVGSGRVEEVEVGAERDVDSFEQHPGLRGHVRQYEVPSLAEPRERLPFQHDPVLGGRGREVELGFSSRHSQECGGR